MCSSDLLNQENTDFKKFSPTMEHLLDPIALGWAKSNRVLMKVTEFLVRTCHNTHMNTKVQAVADSLAERCTYCKVGIDMFRKEKSGKILVESTWQTLPSPPVAIPDSLKLAVISNITQKIVDYYWNIRSTFLCKARLSSKELLRYEEDGKTGLLFYKGRLSQDSKISVIDLDLLDLSFLDSHEISFCNPCIMPGSIIFYSFAMWIHLQSVPHMGLESTLLELTKRFHPVQPRKTLTRILSDCVKCKIIRKKVLRHEMSKHSSLRTTLAPPFTFIMCDLAQNFLTKSRHSGRQTMKAPALIVCCLISGATAIYMLEDWSTQSVIQALERHGCRYGFPLQLFVDSGSQLKKLSSVTYSILDLTNLLYSKFACDIVVAPPKSHSSQGRVERRIGFIKTALEKVNESGLILSFLNWETLFHRISNDLNNLPISRASSTGTTRPEWNILTPNRLLIGRNNKRSLSGPLIVDSGPSAILERISAAQEAWYRVFLKQLHLLIPSPKWFKRDQIEVGDIVLFFVETQIKSTSTLWHYGIVLSVQGHRLLIEYTLPPSNTKKEIERSKRDVVRIASEAELDFNSSSHAQRINE